MDVAALRAKQLRRGARMRFDAEQGAAVPHKAERVAMEEVRRGLVSYDVPRAKTPAPRGRTAHERRPNVRDRVIGALQGLGASTVFVLALFIGFCVVVGFTKTKKTAGGNARVVKSLDERHPSAVDLSARRSAPHGPPTS